MRRWSPSGNGDMEMRIALCSYSQKEKAVSRLLQGKRGSNESGEKEKYE